MRLGRILGAVLACLLATPAAAQLGPRGSTLPLATITANGTGMQNQPASAQPNVNLISPYNAPYNVVPDGPGVTPGASTQTAAVRLANRLALSQWWKDVGQTYPGGIQALGDYTIEVCVQPSLPTVTNQSQGSLDFRNTSALAGSETLSVRNGAQIVAYDCNTSTAPVQAPIVRLGGRAQRVTLTAQAFVSPTVGPVVSNATSVTFSAGQMTVTGTLNNNQGGAISSGATTGTIQVGQYIVRAPGTSSTIPVGCYVTAYVSGGTNHIGGGAIYTIDGGPVGTPHSCQSYTNAVGQTVYFGQAAEVANNAEDGDIGFALSCPVDSEYDLYATKVATGRSIEPYAAGTAGYGSCNAGNTSYNNTWRRFRASTISYRPTDMQSWNAGGSGDMGVQLYFGNGGNPWNICDVENKYFATIQQENCESAQNGYVESADYLNINTASSGGQTNIIPIAVVYQVGGFTQDTRSLLHFESIQIDCSNSDHAWMPNPASHTIALTFQGSGTVETIGDAQALSTTLTSCTTFAWHRLFGTDVKLHVKDYFDGGTSGGSGSWTLNGATVSLATSDSNNLTRGVYEATQFMLENSPAATTSASVNLTSADAPVLRFTSLPTYQIFSGAQTTTVYIPTFGGLQGATEVEIKACGAGGGGGAGAWPTSGSASGGGGGGGGGCDDKKYAASEYGASQSMTIGAVGSAGAAATSNAAGGNGGQGGNVTFGTIFIAYGGGGGQGGALAANSSGGGGGGCAVGSTGSGGTGGTGGGCGAGGGGSGGNGASGNFMMGAGGAGGTNANSVFFAGSATMCPGGGVGGWVNVGTGSGNGGVGGSVMNLTGTRGNGGTAQTNAGLTNGSNLTASNPGGAGGGGAGNNGGAGFQAGTSAQCAGGSGGGSGNGTGVAGQPGGVGFAVVMTR